MAQKQDKKDIRSFDLEQLKLELETLNEKPFRAKQIFEWLWKKSATEFEQMTNLSKELRSRLIAAYVINNISTEEYQKSEDRTIKSAFKLYDGPIVEGVLIPTDNRMTACISSQVGCSLTCAFCATGKLKRVRNLNADEMYDQVVAIASQASSEYNVPLTNIVYMGMGEPLLNYKNTLRSVDRITAEDGLNMSPKRITISTAGVAKMIMKLGDDKVKFNLALSLHAANDQKRSQIMPINEQNSLKALAEALTYFYEKTGTRVTYEYIIFDKFNDELTDAKELYDFSKWIPCKINIIEYNPIDNGTLKQAAPHKVDAFAKYLEDKGVIVNIRRSRGKDIDAACGQLANKNKAALK